MNEKLKHALALAAKGWPIIPLAANSKKPPYGVSWPDVATCDPIVIRKWFSDTPDMNYGVAPIEGQFVLDVDAKNGAPGYKSLEDLELDNGELPETFIVRTPTDGAHLYFNGIAPVSANKASLRGSIDVRGNQYGRGGYVVGPGSTLDGREYKVVLDRPVADAPGWLVKLCAQKEHVPLKRAPGAELDSAADVEYVTKFLQHRVEQGDVAIEGAYGDNRTFKLMAYVQDFISRDKALELVCEHWNPHCVPPWSDAELATKADNAAKHRQNDAGARSARPASTVFAEYKPGPEPEPKRDGIDGVQFERMSDTRTERINWLWDNRIPGDMLTLIGGDPDCGKSTLLTGVAAIITNGGTMPDGSKTEQGSILVLNAEDGAAKILVPRLMAAGANLKYVHRVKPMVKVDGGQRVFDLYTDVGALDKKIAKLAEDGEPPVRLIQIDPLNAYYGANVDGHNAAELRRLLTPLAEWAELRRITVIGVLHLNKGNASVNPLNRLNGSHAVGAAARSVILAAPERDADGKETGRFLLMRGKNNLAPRTIKNMSYRLEGVPVKLDDGTTQEHPVVRWGAEVDITANEAFDPSYSKGHGSKKNKAEAFLLSVLADGPMSVKDLMQKATERGISWRTVEAAKAKLSVRSEQHGFQNNHWMWRLRNKEAEDAANDVNRPRDPDHDLLYPNTLN